MTDADNAAQIIKDLAKTTAHPPVLQPGNLYGYTDYQGKLHALNLQGDEYREFPRHKKGHVEVDDVGSFARYYERHADEDSEIFANRDAGLITAVLDAHRRHDPEDDEACARWQQHLLTLRLTHTPEWTTWTRQNGHMSAQVTFAEFIEDHITDIAPDGPCKGAELVEMAQQFQAHTKVNFSSGSRLASGETQFTYAESIEAKAGERGQITIPGAFELAIRVFEDLDPYRVKARFRYRITDGQLLLGYRLNDPERIARDAIDLVIGKAEEATGAVIMCGRP